MNIQFNIIAHGLEKAAALEKFLKDNGIAFEATMAEGVCERKKRKQVGKIEVVAVLNEARHHPRWSHEQIAKATGVSDSTVSRILLGTHVLQVNGAAPKALKAMAS